MKGTGWHEGWYMAVVNDVLDKDAGRTSIVYVVETSEVYEISVKEMLEEGTIRITNGGEMDERRNRRYKLEGWMVCRGSARS